MKVNDFCSILLWCLVSVFVYPQIGCAQNLTTVEGIIYELQGKGGDSYTPLGNVSVQAYRNGKPLYPNPVKSDDRGRYSISVEAGAPFKLVFYGDKHRIPELQQLAGKEEVSDHIEVAILTVEEQRAILASSRSTQTFLGKLRCLLAELPEGSEPFKNLQETIAENPE